MSLPSFDILFGIKPLHHVFYNFHEIGFTLDHKKLCLNPYFETEK
jgi:hypothetical protein